MNEFSAIIHNNSILYYLYRCHTHAYIRYTFHRSTVYKTHIHTVKVPEILVNGKYWIAMYTLLTTILMFYAAKHYLDRNNRFNATSSVEGRIPGYQCSYNKDDRFP